MNLPLHDVPPASDHQQTERAPRDPDASCGAIIFVGAVLPEPDLASRAFNTAGNKFQLNLLEGLASASPGAVTALSMRPAVAFPFGKSILFRSGRGRTNGSGIDIQFIPFLNVVGLKELSVALSFFIALLRWMRRTRGQQQTIIVFNVFSPFSLSVLLAAALGGAKAVALVADLPFDFYKFRGIKGLLERLDLAVQTRAIRHFAGLVQLTQWIGADLAPNVPAITLEGGVDPADAGEGCGLSRQQGGGEVICMFSGTLNEINGVRLLLDAFAQIQNPQIRLHVYGAGELQDLVIRAAAADPRIYYGGLVPNGEVLQRQRAATMLLNPRPSDQRVTRYTFPSKLLEYMLSGRPVLTTVLPGIPREYFDHLIPITPETPQALARAIEVVAGRDEESLRVLGQAGRAFVLERKNWPKQAQRVTQFIGDLWGEALAS